MLNDNLLNSRFLFKGKYHGEYGFALVYLLILFSLLFTSNSFANCEDILQKLQRKEAIEFARYIHKSNPEFYKSSEVRSQQRRLEKAGVNISSQPQDMIADWLEVLDKTHGSAIGNERVKEKIEEYYFKKYIIKAEDIPDSYYESQQRIAREQGHGNITLTKAAKQNLADILIKDQKDSLRKWLDYLLSTDANYPFWKKYWSFTSLLKMGPFDIEKAIFQKRSKGQVALFPELNQEALAKVFDQVGEGKSNDYNFAKKYALEFNQIRLDELKIHDELTKVEGQWIKYDKGSDESKLVASLENKSTGWCTAGRETAKAQLKNGDFHVFYSFDEQGNPTIPRVAIRFEGSKIAEVRGRDKNQNLDSKIAGSNIVESKLKEFGKEGDHYQKKSSDMKLLTLIEKKIQDNTELSKQDLRFLYEIDHKIEGFGYGKDPRIEEITYKRRMKNDLAFIFDTTPYHISAIEEEALSGDIIFHFGDLELHQYNSPARLKLPTKISGDLILRSLTSAKGLKLPDHVGGTLNLENLTSADGLNLPDYIGGNLNLYSISSAQGLKLPDYIGGYLQLYSLTSAEGLKFPDHVGELNLYNLTSSKGLKLPDQIKGNLNLHKLTSAQGLNLPEYIGGDLELYNLTSAEGLKLPDYIGGDLDLSHLSSAQGLKLPNRVGGNLILHNLSSAEGLKLPNYVGGNLILYNLESTQELEFPDYIGGNLQLPNLTSANGLQLPDHIGGNLNLYNLTSANELKLPRHIEKSLDLSHLTSARGVKFPDYVGGDIHLDRLISNDGLELPAHIGKGLHVNIKNTLEWPKGLKGAIIYERK